MRKRGIFYVAMASVLCLIGLTFLGGWYTVNQGDRALVLRFGKVVETAEPGFHFKLPFIDSVEKISVRTRKLTENRLTAYSRDVQGADILLSVNYALEPARVSEIYSQIGVEYESRVITPQILSKTKDVFGRYNAVEIVRSREKLTGQIVGELQQQFSTTGIKIESVQIENIDFSDEYERSVEERMKAEVEVTKVQQNLEREKVNAEMLRTKASGEADARVAAARAEAEAIKMRGNAEAEAIKAKADALAQNPSLVNLIQAERWDGKLPMTMVPGNAVPFIGVK